MNSLKAIVRETNEKTGQLRQGGYIPAVLYGDKVSSLPIKVAVKDFEKMFREAGESSLFNLEVGGKKYTVLVHQIARDALSGQFTHIDFYHPSAQKEVEVEVPIIFEGESDAVKTLGGILVKETQELKIKGLAHELMREIKVDISRLNKIGDRICVKDLRVSPGIEILKDMEDIIVLVQEPAEEATEESTASPLDNLVSEIKESDKDDAEN